MPLPRPLPDRTVKEEAQRHSGRIDEINDDRSGCVTLEQPYLDQDKAFFGAADLQIRSSPPIGTRVTFTLLIDPEDDCLRCGTLGVPVARTRSRSRSREDGRAPLRRKPQTVPPRVLSRTANGHTRTSATGTHELPETAKMLAAERACVADGRAEVFPADVESDEVKADMEEDAKSDALDAAGGADEAKGPGLDEELRDHLKRELGRTSSGRFRKHLVAPPALKMWTGVIFKWSVETEEGWLLPDDDIRHDCLPTSGMVWFSHDHTEADLPDDPEGRRVQFLVYEQNGSLGAIFVKLVDADQTDGQRLRSPGSRPRLECRPPSSSWQHPNHMDEAEDGEEEDEEDDQEVSGFGPSWFRMAEEPEQRRLGEDEEDPGWDRHRFEEDNEDMDLDDEPPEALAASVSAPKSSAASKSPANSAPSAPRLPLALSSARQALQDEVALVAQDLETHWSPAELKRRLMRYLSHGLEKLEKKSTSLESWKEAAQTFLKESSTQFYWTCSGKPWYPEAEDKIKPVLEMVAWELIQDCPGAGPGSKEVLQNMIEEEFVRYAEQRNFQDTVHNAVAESFNELEDDVRKKVITSLQKMHPGACEAVKAATGHRLKKIEAFVRQWMKDSMDRSYNAVKQQQKDIVFSEKRMTLLFKCLISPEGSEFSCLPRDLLHPDGTGRPPRNWKFIREAVIELVTRWQQNAKK